MTNLIKINFESEDRPTVSGRELHDALEVKTAYKDWFPRMCEYGFEEGKDFSSFLSESTGGRPSTDHILTLDGDIWLLYQKYAQQGYTSTKTSIYNGSDGTEHAKVHTYWTQKGRLFIYDLLKSDGLLPLIEKEK